MFILFYNYLYFLNYLLPSFLRKKIKKNIRFNFLNSSFLGNNFISILSSFFSIVLSDQYCAKKFLKNDSIVFDIGANIGVFSVFAASLANSGKIYAFEPVKGTFSFLKENSKNYTNIFCINSGLGKKEEKKKILNIEDGNASNVLEDSPYFLKTIKKSNGNFEFVDITTLDLFVKKEGISRVDFIKIDTEGYESNVLEGAKDVIKKFHPVIVMSAYHNKNDKAELPKLLRSFYSEYICEFRDVGEEDLICYVDNKN